MKISPNLAKLQWALLLAVLLATSGCLLPRQHVYLTWRGDPSTTMTVHFHTTKPIEPSIVYYDTEPRNAAAEDYQFLQVGESNRMTFLKHRRYVHTVHLDQLSPGTRYYFALGNGAKGLCRKKEFAFRTLPNNGSPIRFIVGGDISILPRAKRLVKQAAKFEPMFGVVGGDIAYANGKPRSAWLWDIWLHRWQKHMVGPDGELLPMVLAVGNHETNDSEGPPQEVAPYYFGYADQGGKSYFSRNLGQDAVLMVLDSGHIVPHDGAQRAWLEAELEKHRDKRIKMAVYHVPLYPSHRGFDYGGSANGRQHWEPLFGEYGLDVGFECHDHTFKRTPPIRNGELHPDGTVYLGDGSMGVSPRNITNPDAWYLDKASGTPHFWLVDIDEGNLNCRAVNKHGEVFDRYP